MIPAPVIRVLVVDDDPLVRGGLRLMLGGAPDLEIVGDVADGDEVLEAVRRLEPEVVLMDVRMTRVDGISAIRTLRSEGLTRVPAVIVLTTFRTDATVLEALRAGAAGFLLKHTPPAEIVAAIRTAASGQPTVSGDVLRQLIDHVTAGEAPARIDGPDPLSPLTDREREVALAVAEGLGNAEIAGRLFLSHGSVKAHISSALAKLGLDNRIQLAILAHESRSAGR
ncbi:DNA-binding NarL/FixJ family response regulator [Conyzicola nivalis]|uniref:DNA-binding NarL/FixJ family response regulator n=1 Tax=Conyzicola nivalis TaxID=1477021 RepID=A0ABV2QKE7_9MICO